MSKNSDESVLYKAVEQVALGEIFVEDNLVPRLLDVKNMLSLLTKREQEVAKERIKGLNNTEIAQKLNLSVRTIENYVSRIYDKLGITTRDALIKVIN